MQINENKTKAELLIEINNLKKQISGNEEFLAEIGIIQKETFMSRIEALEENTKQKIFDLIIDCVNETGRDFPWILVDHKKFKYANACGMSEDMYKENYHSNKE